MNPLIPSHFLTTVPPPSRPLLSSAQLGRLGDNQDRVHGIWPLRALFSPDLGFLLEQQPVRILRPDHAAASMRARRDWGDDADTGLPGGFSTRWGVPELRHHVV